MNNTAIGIVAYPEFSMDRINLKILDDYNPYRKSSLNPVRKCNAISANFKSVQRFAEI